MVVHVFRPALADAPFGVLLSQEPPDAALHHVAEPDLPGRIDGVGFDVARKIRVSRAEEREHREPCHAGVVLAIASARALRPAAVRGEGIRTPTAVRILMAREPEERRFHGGLRIQATPLVLHGQALATALSVSEASSASAPSARSDRVVPSGSLGILASDASSLARIEPKELLRLALSFLPRLVILSLVALGGLREGIKDAGLG